MNDENQTEIYGVFDGQNMVADDGRTYLVPPNYASKSRLLEGDQLVLRIDEYRGLSFKQISPVPFKVHFGEVVVEGSLLKVLVEGQSYKILRASINYFKLKRGDKVMLRLPQNTNAVWGAVDQKIEEKELDKELTINE